ncbi:hypothetical protein NPIL_229121 [Nephila pilipes]|uniref:Reverse transcriptase Ty1/copia-type domain-containing protein n=1 Tax=Nephila pilipes TaxID=299642 RepID=A0A8X6P960_NEPPI|nr:hypothetical protein NPIL_229121 [Nephila pilipes]
MMEKKNDDKSHRKIGSRCYTRQDSGPKDTTRSLGLTFDENFSSVVNHTTRRVLLTAEIYERMHVNNVNIIAAFLHRDHHEDFYMQHLEGYVKLLEDQKVCKLKKFLYGPKKQLRLGIKYG